MTTNEIKQVLHEYLATAITLIIEEMSETDSRPTPEDIISKFRAVCQDDNHHMEELRQERLRRYHDSDRAHQLERLTTISQKIPDKLVMDFVHKIKGKLNL